MRPRTACRPPRVPRGTKRLARDGQTLGEPATLRHERTRLLSSKAAEQRIVRCELALPLRGVDRHGLPESTIVERHAGPVQIAVARRITERRLDRAGPAGATLDDPFQYAHVLAEARPHEPALAVLAEPVDTENPRRMGHGAAHVQPVSEVIAHVVAAERQHRKRVAAHRADRTGCRSG